MDSGTVYHFWPPTVILGLTMPVKRSCGMGTLLQSGPRGASAEPPDGCQRTDRRGTPLGAGCAGSEDLDTAGVKAARTIRVNVVSCTDEESRGPVSQHQSPGNHPGFGVMLAPDP